MRYRAGMVLFRDLGDWGTIMSYDHLLSSAKVVITKVDRENAIDLPETQG